MRRSYVRTYPSTEPAMMVVASTWRACTASRASSSTWIGARDWDLRARV